MGKKIMLVDDTKFMRMMLTNILKPKGFEIVAEASDGLEAIDKYKATNPDLVTMDIVMPNMEGIEAVKNIVAADSNAKIIMITAIGQESKVKEAIQAGAKGYVVKPFKAPRVLEEIEKVLG
ncbi:two-component system response regulator [Thermoplasmatales archaeon ex4572_165]|nr:MAG: two-component system response regulator [Thermoplasmatales archaeon ex4572_165]